MVEKPLQNRYGSIRMPVSVCPYFPHQPTGSAPSVFLQGTDLSPEECDELLDQGWRHFGRQYYRNDCPGCQRCMPLRIPVMHLELSHSQRRLLRKSTDLESRFFSPDEFSVRYFFEALEIHNAFIQDRHGHRAVTPGEFHASFFSSPAPLVIHGLFDPNGILIGCGWLDAGRRSLSSIYYSWHPDSAKHSPGTLSMLREALYSRETGRTYYHLGYWIEGHRSMAYKAGLHPSEILLFCNADWISLPADSLRLRHSPT